MKTLHQSMSDFIQFMNDHTGLEDFQVEATQAHESTQKTIISDLDDEIHEHGLVELVNDSDGTTINTDKLVMWLEENYTVYPR